MQPTLKRRDALAIFLLAVGSAWGAGNIGPIVPDLVAGVRRLADERRADLRHALLPRHARRARLRPEARRARRRRPGACGSAAVLVGVGCVIMAVAPDFAALGAGRVVAGFGLGAIAAVGPVFGRDGRRDPRRRALRRLLPGRDRVRPRRRQRPRRRRRRLADRLRRLRRRRVLGASSSSRATATSEMELKGGGFLHAAVRSPAVYRLGAALHRDVRGAARSRRLARPLPLGPGRDEPDRRRRPRLRPLRRLRRAPLRGRRPRQARRSRVDPRRRRCPLLATVGIVAIAFDQSVVVALVAVVADRRRLRASLHGDDHRRPADLARRSRPTRSPC